MVKIDWVADPSVGGSVVEPAGGVVGNSGRIVVGTSVSPPGGVVGSSVTGGGDGVSMGT